MTEIPFRPPSGKDHPEGVASFTRPVHRIRRSNDGSSSVRQPSRRSGTSPRSRWTVPAIHSIKVILFFIYQYIVIISRRRSSLDGRGPPSSLRDTVTARYSKNYEGMVHKRRSHAEECDRARYPPSKRWIFSTSATRHDRSFSGAREPPPPAHRGIRPQILDRPPPRR